MNEIEKLYDDIPSFVEGWSSVAPFTRTGYCLSCPGEYRLMKVADGRAICPACREVHLWDEDLKTWNLESEPIVKKSRLRKILELVKDIYERYL